SHVARPLLAAQAVGHEPAHGRHGLAAVTDHRRDDDVRLDRHQPADQRVVPDGLQRAGEPDLDTFGRRPRMLDVQQELVEVAPELPPDDLFDQLVLGDEPTVDGDPGDAGAARDVAHRRPADAHAAELLVGGVEHADRGLVVLTGRLASLRERALQQRIRVGGRAGWDQELHVNPLDGYGLSGKSVLLCYNVAQGVSQFLAWLAA